MLDKSKEGSKGGEFTSRLTTGQKTPLCTSNPRLLTVNVSMYLSYKCLRSPRNILLEQKFVSESLNHQSRCNFLGLANHSTWFSFFTSLLRTDAAL